jgi:hypothetical protein
MTNILIGGDYHCGAQQGITPPGYEEGPATKWHKAQIKLWERYRAMIKTLPPIDHFILMGDLIDGQATRQSGFGLITGDIRGQAKMAVAAIKVVKAKKHYMVFGTDYHVVVGGIDMEEYIADELGVSEKSEERGDHIFPIIAGKQFDLKHKVGCSSLPASRIRTIAQEMEHAKQWVLEGGQPMPDILVRAHCHYYVEARGTTQRGEWLSLITPGLQGLGSRYGAKICTGVIHFGLVLITIDKKRGVGCKPLLSRP